MPPNDLKTAVGHRLLDLGKTKLWLCGEVTERTGRYCDYGTLHRVLNGTTKRTPIISAIREILNLPEE